MDVRDTVAASLNSPEFERGISQEFWELQEVVRHLVYVVMTARDGERYHLELQCDSYGSEPIRGRFVDSGSLACVSTAWPTGNATFAGWFKWSPNELFICWPGDRGGIEHHADWRALQHWCKTSNQLVQYLEFIRQCLTLPARGYQPQSAQAA